MKSPVQVCKQTDYFEREFLRPPLLVDTLERRPHRVEVQVEESFLATKTTQTARNLHCGQGPTGERRTTRTASAHATVTVTVTSGSRWQLHRSYSDIDQPAVNIPRPLSSRMVDSKLKAGSQCAGHCPSVALFEAGTAGDSTQLGHTESPSHGLTFHPLSGTRTWALSGSRCCASHGAICWARRRQACAPHLTRAGSGCQGPWSGTMVRD